MKFSPWIWPYVANVKSEVKILSIFVVFLGNMNFNGAHNGSILKEIPFEYFQKM